MSLSAYFRAICVGAIVLFVHSAAWAQSDKDAFERRWASYEPKAGELAKPSHRLLECNFILRAASRRWSQPEKSHVGRGAPPDVVALIGASRQERAVGLLTNPDHVLCRESAARVLFVTESQLCGPVATDILQMISKARSSSTVYGWGRAAPLLISCMTYQMPMKSPKGDSWKLRARRILENGHRVEFWVPGGMEDSMLREEVGLLQRKVISSRLWLARFRPRLLEAESREIKSGIRGDSDLIRHVDRLLEVYKKDGSQSQSVRGSK